MSEQESQHYFITPPTLFLPESGLRITVIGIDEEWTNTLGDVLEGSLPNIPMTFYHLDKPTADEWQWQYHMIDISNLIMVNVARATQLDLLMAFAYMGQAKLWFYVDVEEVDKNTIILLNTMNANVFTSAEELVSMLHSYSNE